MADITGDEIPDRLVDLLSGRDRGPLSDEVFVRYQYIGLTPAIGVNRRFVLNADGRLFGSVNTGSLPRPGERFDVALPDEPTTALADDTMDAIRASLARVGFHDSPIYVASEGTRDGAAAIVAARASDGSTHEVWYVNVDNDLTDLLWSLLERGGAGPPDSAQDLAELERIRDGLS